MRGTAVEGITDTELQQDAVAELDWEPSVNAANIGVSVSEGVVTLRGTVDSYYEKSMAERAVKRVAGVRAVVDDLDVKLARTSKRTDADIAKAALAVLEWDITVPNRQLNVTVEDGRVKLGGEVNWDYQRRAAERAVRNLTGVKSVLNLINVEPMVAARDIKSKITAALHRSAQLEAEKISVEASGGKVTLKGTVRSWGEKAAAETAARAAPGVREVENFIVVKWS